MVGIDNHQGLAVVFERRTRFPGDWATFALFAGLVVGAFPPRTRRFLVLPSGSEMNASSSQFESLPAESFDLLSKLLLILKVLKFFSVKLSSSFSISTGMSLLSTLN